MRKNDMVAKLLYEIADLLEIKEVQWKPQAYRKAAQTIESLSEDIAAIAKKGNLEKLEGVGEHIAQKIEEIVKKGKSTYLSKLKKQIPIDVDSFSRIEGMGPKTIKRLYKKLKIKNINDLKKAIKAGKVKKLSGLGEKKQQQFLQGMKYIKQSGKQRVLLGFADPIVEELVDFLEGIPGTQKVTPAGSFRRGKETIGDVDILVVSSKPKQVMDVFVKMDGVKRVLAKGATKTSVKLINNLQVDVRIVKKEQYGSALQYFTGSKEHNVALRKIALKKGLTLSEYGLFKRKSKKLVAAKTEKEIYARLGVQYIPSEMRENLGEIQLAQKKKLPRLVTEKDMQGYFHTHSTWSDGDHSIQQMVKKAKSLGWKYILMSDHVGDISVANSLGEKRLAKQAKAIAQVNKKIKGITVLHGAEIDINKKGELKLSKQACKKLDVVIASVHMAFRMPVKEMTKRLCDVMENYPVHILAHPSARLINKRAPIAFNLEKVFQTAKDQGVFLEINSQPKRLDLKDLHIHTARELGCKFVISSDAHSTDQLEQVKYGVITAQRGWLQKKHVLNTRSVAEVRKVLRR